MTNEEARAWLEHHFDPLPDGTKQSEAVSLAIKALETIPKYKDAYNKGWDDGAKAAYVHLKMCEEEQGGNLISRDMALEKMADYVTSGYADSVEDFEEYSRIICQLPSVNPQEPKTGHWEWVQYDYNPKIGNWHCSECRCIVVECVGKEDKGGIPLYKYCPQCGIKMKSQESEDV